MTKLAIDLLKLSMVTTVKPVLSDHSKRWQKLVFKTDYRLMQVKRIAEILHSAILSICIKLPSVFKTVVLSIFEWPLKTWSTVCSFRFYAYFKEIIGILVCFSIINTGWFLSASC